MLVVVVVVVVVVVIVAVVVPLLLFYSYCFVLLESPRLKTSSRMLCGGFVRFSKAVAGRWFVDCMGIGEPWPHAEQPHAELVHLELIQGHVRKPRLLMQASLAIRNHDLSRASSMQ